MTMFKPFLMKEFSSYVPIKLSLSQTVIVFVLKLDTSCPLPLAISQISHNPTAWSFIPKA